MILGKLGTFYLQGLRAEQSSVFKAGSCPLPCWKRGTPTQEKGAQAGAGHFVNG